MNLEIRAVALRWKIDGVFIPACAYGVRFDYVAIPALDGNAASRAIVEKYFYAARHVYADSTVMPLLLVVSPDYSSVSNGYEGDYERCDS
jgi:hypothetical protein